MGSWGQVLSLFFDKRGSPSSMDYSVSYKNLQQSENLWDLNLLHCKLFCPLITLLVPSNFSTPVVKCGYQDWTQTIGTAVPKTKVVWVILLGF